MLILLIACFLKKETFIIINKEEMKKYPRKLAAQNNAGIYKLKNWRDLQGVSLEYCSVLLLLTIIIYVLL